MKTQGYRIQIEPRLSSSSSSAPDFLAKREGEEPVVVEVAYISRFDKGESRKVLRVTELFDQINRDVLSPRFLLRAGRVKVPSEIISLRLIIEKLRAHLKECEQAVSGPNPCDRISLRHLGWVLEFDLFDKHKYGFSGGCPDLSPWSGGVQGIDIPQMIRNALTGKKPSKYGVVRRRYVVAICTSGFDLPHECLVEALYGNNVLKLDRLADGSFGNPFNHRKRNGVWLSGKGFINRRMSGVLTLSDFGPYNMHDGKSTLFIHPAGVSEISLNSKLRRFPVCSLEGENLVIHPGENLASLMGVPKRTIVQPLPG